MWLKIILTVIILLIVVLTALTFYGKRQWQESTRSLQVRLAAAREPMAKRSYDPAALKNLPQPVQRYFRRVLTPGQPLIAAVNLRHRGTFNMGQEKAQWKPFRSRQRVVISRPGFVWDARIQMAPLTKVFVHDAYVAGEGVLQAKIQGLITVMEQPSTPELARGELMRFFAEAAWYPTALLPPQGVAWESTDSRRAAATLTDGGISVRLVFQFDEDGYIGSVQAEARYRDVNGTAVPTPWEGRFWDYHGRDGMMIPLQGEVGWIIGGKFKSYWRGRMQEILYEFVQ